MAAELGDAYDKDGLGRARHRHDSGYHANATSEGG